MSHRRDEYFERFREDAEKRGWNEDQVMFLARMMIRGCGSTEHGLRMFREIIRVEDGIRKAETEQAVDDFDRVFTDPVYTPAQFRQTEQFKKSVDRLYTTEDDGRHFLKADAGWDEDGDFQEFTD